MIERRIVLKLTPEQQRAIDPLLNEAAAHAARGKPVMVIAQIVGEYMKAGVLPHERARLLAMKDSEGEPHVVRELSA